MYLDLYSLIIFTRVFAFWSGWEVPISCPPPQYHSYWNQSGYNSLSWREVFAHGANALTFYNTVFTIFTTFALRMKGV